MLRFIVKGVRSAYSNILERGSIRCPSGIGLGHRLHAMIAVAYLRSYVRIAQALVDSFLPYSWTAWVGLHPWSRIRAEQEEGNHGMQMLSQDFRHHRLAIRRKFR